MNKQDLSFIQDQIGYTFKNPDLLRQAFTRRSYSYENGGEHNEILEFIGDAVLELIVVKILSEKFGCTKDKLDNFNPNNVPNEYVCDSTEGELSKIKIQLVQKRNLAKCMDDLGLERYLIMGKCDQNQRANNQPSVKEDLFEAILGAVAIDSCYNIETLQDTVEVMLRPESIFENNEQDDFITPIQEWCAKENGTVPLYHFEEGSYSSSWHLLFRGISQSCNTFLDQEYRDLMAARHSCIMKIDDNIPPFRGFGKNKSEARKSACKVAYKWLEENHRLHTIRNELRNPNKCEAVGQLETLARRHYFSIPTYDFTQSYDKDGNALWTAKCHVKEIKYFPEATLSSKSAAKREVAYAMLKYVLGKYEKAIIPCHTETCRVETNIAKSLFGILPDAATLEEATEERRDKI